MRMRTNTLRSTIIGTNDSKERRIEAHEAKEINPCPIMSLDLISNPTIGRKLVQNCTLSICIIRINTRNAPLLAEQKDPTSRLLPRPSFSLSIDPSPSFLFSKSLGNFAT
jgi:hypothetical protein